MKIIFRRKVVSDKNCYTKHVTECRSQGSILTSSFFVFQSVVNRVNISGNIDNPEGTLDALMQIAVCDKVRMFVF